ncbi:MAG: glycosyltransferase family 2 protein [Clostridium cadaveris]|uniref:glycosyltransferase family A protein n=1 Tax=Clostridium cadaveris TaxID=1529 RepID=UPI002A859BA4|nr:glycosyltransferase family 2 protein [Clostridium cadaveris]
MHNNEYKKGLVSCIIPTYKRNNTLIRAINSVMNQTYSNLEILVIDDNVPNDENSLSVQKQLKAISDNRIRYIQQEKHINGAVARNVGINSAKGEFVAFLDDDDEWKNTKIEKQVEFLNENPKIGGVSSYYEFFNNDILVRKCYPYNCNEIHKKIIGRSVAVFTSTVLMRRISLDKSGYFDESLKRHQDLQLLLDFTSVNKFEVISEYLVCLHIDDEMNRGNSRNIVEIKNMFFEKEKSHFDKYDKHTKRRLYDAHYFEIIFSALKGKRLILAIKYLCKIGFNIYAYKDVMIRYKERKINL